MVNAALFRAQPFADRDRLVEIYQNRGDPREPALTSFPAYRDIVERSDVFEGVTAYLENGVTYRAGDVMRSGAVEYASASHLSVLGLRPALGRWFSAEEDAAGSAAVAVISYEAWRRRFNGDPSIVGQTVQMNGVPVAIVGIGPAALRSTLNAGFGVDFWLSTGSILSVEAFTLPPALLEARKELLFFVKARLSDGVTVAQAQAVMASLGDQLAKEFPDADPGQGISVFRSTEVYAHPSADKALIPVALVLLTIVGFVLAIACTNLATLLLIRGASRSKEVSVRLALGASRTQLVRYLLTESLLLTLAGGAAGAAFAWVVTRIVAALDLPLILDLSLDSRVLAYVMTLSIVTGLVFGLAPALKATRVDLVPALRDEGSALSLTRKRFGLTNMLVVFQVAASFLLLFCTGTLVRVITGATTIDLGFPVDQIAILESDPRYAGYSIDASRQLQEQVLNRVRSLPGVDAATLTNGSPIGGFVGDRRVTTDGASDQATTILWKWAGPDYFKTLGIGVLFGREFDASDRRETTETVIINRKMAQQLFGTDDAAGRYLRFEQRENPGSWTRAEIVGVVGNARIDVSLNDPQEPLFYRSITQSDAPAQTIMARTSLHAAALAGAMQRELRALDPQVPVFSAATIRQKVDESLSAVQKVAGILAGLSLLGLALAGLGLYAVVSFGVTQRVFEVGIRMALGARSSEVVRVVTRDVTALVGAGIGAGALLAAIAAALMMSSGMLATANLTFSGPVADATTIAVICVLMIGVASAAAFFPARQATKIDPLVAMRRSG